MLTMFQIIGIFQPKAEMSKADLPAPVVVRKPMANFENPSLPEPAESYSCLEDVFGKMLDEQHPLAISKW